MDNIIKRNEEYVDVRRLNHRHTVSWDPGVADDIFVPDCDVFVP